MSAIYIYDKIRIEEGKNMKIFISKFIKSAILISLAVFVFTSGETFVYGVDTTINKQQPVNVQAKGIYVKPLTLINSPKTYLNKTVILEGKFDKFSTLGLDYKPAFKSSDDYISFLIKRDDTSFNIPLSELKLFLKRSDAEKYIDLKSGDCIEAVGTVFSDALGDTWVDVSTLKITKKETENNK